MPIISGYAGWWLDKRANNYDIVGKCLSPMREAGFNAIDIKIFSQEYGQEEISELFRLGDMVRQSGLAFHAYATPVRIRAGVDFPSVVNEVGERTDRICLRKYTTFRRVYAGAYVLAKYATDLSIQSVKLDLEWIGSLLPCYCDDCWKRFAATKGLPTDAPPVRRYGILVERNLDECYVQTVSDDWILTARAFEREMHEINPYLLLGMMPACDTPLYLPFVRHLADGSTAAIMDSWCMYRGNGYDKQAREAIAWIRSQNTRNIAQPWLWVNSYYVECIAGQCYGALRDGVGYTLYPLSAMRLQGGNHFPRSASPEEYFAEFRRANIAAAERLAGGATYKETIQVTQVKPLVPECNHQLIRPLHLEPLAGQTEALPVQPIMMRHENVFYVLVDVDQPLSFQVKHVCQDIGTSIGVAIVDTTTGLELYSANVPSGQKRHFTYPVDRRRLLGVIFNGGEVGPWYQVQFDNRRLGALGYRPDCYTHFYFMEHIDRSVFLLPLRHALSFRFTLSGGPVEYRLFVPDGRCVANGRTKPPNHLADIQVEIPAGTPHEPWRLELRSPTQLFQGEYVQNCWLDFRNGLEPLFGFSPGGMLCLKEGEKLNVPSSP
ncbi:MAG: hypothetical protein IJJ33_00655 [Victivallales bacterium]|nr:hypothetical protein [Victivallales bacterium]